MDGCLCVGGVLTVFAGWRGVRSGEVVGTGDGVVR